MNLYDNIYFKSARFAEGGDVSWGNWLWSMMPSVLSQEEDLTTMNNDVDVTCTFHVGFCVKILETNLKV